jgi:hypothetical protein
MVRLSIHPAYPGPNPGGAAHTLIWYLLSPSYRRKTNARWKRTRPHRLVFEIGTGILGLLIFCALIGLVLRNLSQ